MRFPDERLAKDCAVDRLRAGQGFRRVKAFCRTKGKFENSHILVDGWEWRGGHGGAEVPATATLSSL